MDLSEVDSSDELTDEQVLDLLTDADEEDVEERKDEIAEGRGGDGENVAVRGKEPRVEGEKLDDEVMRAHHTLRALMAHTNRRHQEAGEHVRKLYEGGHYGYRSLQDDFRHARGAGDFYSTVVDEDGGILLPTEVVDEIQELADQVGVAREIANTMTQVQGTVKLPGATGVEDSADAVAEGGKITSSKRAFQSINLNPQKWAQIIPWSYEAQIELAPQILEDVQRALARSFSRAEDESLLLGDGTSSYNGIDGLFSGNRSVPTKTIGSAGNDDPADIGPDELVKGKNDLDPGARDKENLYYVFHPDLEAVFETKKDNNGQYLFDYVENDDGVGELKGIPVLYTEVLPGTGSNANTQFGALVNGRYIRMAIGEGMTSEEVTQGQIEDANGDTINLTTEDLRALKARMFFDLDFNFDKAAMTFKTNS